MEGINQKRIEYDSLRLQCSLAIQALINFRTVEMPGEHGRGIFRVRLQAGSDAEQIARLIYCDPVALQEIDTDGKTNKASLFSGYIEDIKLFRESEYLEAELTVLSGTVLLDRQKRDRVFQAQGQDYESIIRRVVSGTKEGAYILTAPNQETEGPIFQYQETDWEFLKRVSGYLGLALVAETAYHHPRLYIGMRRGDIKKIPVVNSCTMTFDGEQFYKMRESGVKVAREDFFCYDIITWVNLELGERAWINGRQLSVHRKEMMLQDGEVVFRYRFAGKSHGLTSRKQNTDMIGISLPGRVTATAGQTCELELDLEPGQAGGYQYPFAPETGNMMYCMPQTETRVNLSMGSGEGADAMISCCVRTNGAECEGTGEPSKKSFHTEYEKGIELYPESMGMAGGANGNLLLDDAGGASLTSAKSLIIYARGNIRMESGKIFDLETMSGIFAQTLQEVTSSLYINGRFDYLSADALLRGRFYRKNDPFEDAPKEGHFDWGGFFRNIAIGLAVVAVFAVAAVAVVATGGGAAALLAGTLAAGSKIALGACVGAAIGAAMTTARISIEDFNDGDVRSWQEASREIGISALSGAITGALGAKFPHMNKFLAGLIDTTLSTVERGFLKAFEEDITFGEWLAYTFDPKTMAFDFVIGVGIDFLVDGISDFFKGRRAAQVVDGMTDQMSDAMEDSMIRETREAMEDAVGDNVERTARESAEDAAERAARGSTGDIMDDFDDYERFYEDLFDRQRESFDEYEDFLDDLANMDHAAKDGGSKSVYDIIKGVEDGSIPLANNIQRGNYGEMKMDAYFQDLGYKRISFDQVTDLDAITHHGIDGVYYKPDGHPPYIVAEAKYGSSRLSTLADGTPQMSMDWIEGGKGISRLELSVGKEMADEIIAQGYDSILVRIKSNGNIFTYILDDSGKIIKD